MVIDLQSTVEGQKATELRGVPIGFSGYVISLI